MFKLRMKDAEVPIYAVPYHEGAPLKPIPMTEGIELQVLEEVNPLSRHIPREKPPYLGLDKGMLPLRRDIPEERELFWQVWVFADLTPGSYLLADGRPALLFGAMADPDSRA